MKLIADSGSTKTDWALIHADGSVIRFSTSGLNPSVLDAEIIENQLRSEVISRVKESGVAPGNVSEVHFFGAGCTETKIPVMKAVLATVLGVDDEATEVASDMLGAAIAACEGKAGIAAILGTGSNSCLFDGETIVANTPPLGFILGDEGSGAVLGKLFINKVLKGTLPKTLCDEFLKASGLDKSSVVEKVYRQPSPNKFLASFSPFIHSHLHVEPLRQMVIDNFKSFFRNNLQQYDSQSLAVNVIGSIAFCYESELREAAASEGYEIGKIIKSPIEGLIHYYQKR